MRDDEYVLGPAGVVFEFNANENQRGQGRISLYALEKLVGKELRTGGMCEEAYDMHKDIIHEVVLRKRADGDEEPILIVVRDVL